MAECTLPDGITPEWLMDTFLLGFNLKDFCDTPFGRNIFETGLCTSVSTIEATLGLSLTPKTITLERHDLNVDSPHEFYQKTLDVRPIRTTPVVSLRYGNHDHVYALPVSWTHVRNKYQGEIELIVDASTSGFSLATGWPFLMGPGQFGFNRMPAWFQVAYTAGFGVDAEVDDVDLPIPPYLKEAIGLYASALALETAGRFVLKPGITNMSISMDGLSQSTGTSLGANSIVFNGEIMSFKRRYDQAIAAARSQVVGIKFRAL